MTYIQRTLLMWCILTVIVVIPATAQTADFKPDRLLIRLPEGVELIPEADSTTSAEINALNLQYGLRDAELLFSTSCPGHEVCEGLYGRWTRFDFADSIDVRGAIDAYGRIDGIEVDPDYLVYASSRLDPVVQSPVFAVPNDPLYPNQWALNATGQMTMPGAGVPSTPGIDINVESAWDLFTGSTSVRVAVIDDGIDLGHPAFTGLILQNSMWDFVDGDADASHEANEQHGTAVAGIIGSLGNDGFGTTGVNWSVSLIPIRVWKDCGIGVPPCGWQSDLAKGIVWAISRGAHVINVSGGGYGDGLILTTAVKKAVLAGILTVASTGNDNTSSIIYPAAASSALAVGAINPCGTRAIPVYCGGGSQWGSNYGPQLDVMAPGIHIATADVRGSSGYANGDWSFTFDGTSSAAPLVSGALQSR